MRVPRLTSPRDNELILYNVLKRVTEGLPDQATHAGEFLTTDGTTASWIPGGSGTQTLNQTLVLGNTTGGEDISISNGDKIVLDNGSELRKGTYDYGGSGGISRICSVGYEDMWQSGIHHIFDNNGFIRESNNCFNINPDNTFDNTLRFKVGSRWVLDDGTTYICTDASTGAAVWWPINGVIAITHAEAMTLINNITIGQKYLIIDATANSIPLSVIGTSTTTYSVNADDAAFPTDVVEYDFANDVVSYRWDVVNNISSYEDWRNGTPVCVISLTGTSNIHLEQGCTGVIPANSYDIYAGVNAFLDMQGATSKIRNCNLFGSAVMSDSGFNVLFKGCVVMIGASITVTDAACVSVSNCTIGQISTLNTAHNTTQTDIGIVSTVNFTDNTLSSGNVSIGNDTNITSGSANNYFSTNKLTISTTGNLTDALSLVTQTTSIAATDIAGTETEGLYKLTYYLQVTTADALATSVSATIAWNDASARSNTSAVILLNATNFTQGTLFIKTDGSQAIKYSTTVVTIGNARYALDISVEKIK